MSDRIRTETYLQLPAVTKYKTHGVAVSSTCKCEPNVFTYLDAILSSRHESHGDMGGTEDNQTLYYCKIMHFLTCASCLELCFYILELPCMAHLQRITEVGSLEVGNRAMAPSTGITCNFP